MSQDLIVIGGGLAGTEAAWQAAEAGLSVSLYEMRPQRTTPAHVTGNLAGIPCMSVPCGRTAAGLPVGMQILTNHFNEAGMFRLAGAFEAAGGCEG